MNCPVEDALGHQASVEMDTYLADPSGWPAATFPKGFKVPRPLPSSMRQWGAIKLGLAWCQGKGANVSRRAMATHVREHVPFVIEVETQIAEAGMPTDKRRKVAGDVTLPANPITYQQVYQRGLAVGDRSLQLLAERIEAMIDADEAPPTDLLIKMAELGQKLAQSQATLIIRGIGRQEREDEVEGFRRGSQPLPSERFGDLRVRMIEGKSRPIVDRGYVDRMDYNQRADQEGSAKLPSIK